MNNHTYVLWDMNSDGKMDVYFHPRIVVYSYIHFYLQTTTSVYMHVRRSV